MSEVALEVVTDVVPSSEQEIAVAEDGVGSDVGGADRGKELCRHLAVALLVNLDRRGTQADHLTDPAGGTHSR